jgi:nitronate monooxygenase
MKSNKIPKLRIGDLEARVPIIQGGMSVGVSLSGLASAVANEGGIGVIGATGIGMLEPDFAKNFREANKRALSQEIRKAKEATAGPIGINLLVALTDYEELLLVAIEEKVDLVFLGAGLPLMNPKTAAMDRLREGSTKVVTIVSSARAAKIIFTHWAKRFHHVPDAVVVEGPLAGGHLGFKKEQIEDPEYVLEKLVPEVIAAVRSFEEPFGKSIPVIAAGGIYSGTDIYKFMQLGASGVLMATRFAATRESDASPIFKEAYVACKKEDIVIINSPVGLPGRAIRNQFLDEVSAGIQKPVRCPWQCLRTCDFTKAPYCIALALTNAKRGNLVEGFAFVGANAYRVDKIVSVKELIENLLEEYEEARKGH